MLLSRSSRATKYRLGLSKHISPLVSCRRHSAGINSGLDQVRESHMADVFISYSQKDRDVAKRLADFLNDCGYDVWWDYELVGGTKFRDKVKEELARARAAIVIWTPDSVESDWVVEEAEEAKQSHKLIATRIDGFDYRAIPLGFRSLQTDLVTEPDRIFRALETNGVAPSRPPKAPKIVMGRDLSPDAIARAEQFAHWEFIKDSKEPAKYTAFIEMFPSSSFASLARIQLSKLATEAWQSLSTSEDAAALEEFVRQFPGDTHAAEAQKRVLSLQARAAEAESWARLESSDDLAAVEAHIARFSSGTTMTVARDLQQRLKHKRDEAEQWRAISDCSEADPIVRFLGVYPDSAFATQARARLNEIRRAREEHDWNQVCNERHPAPLLRFLKAYPDGARSTEALKTLQAFPRTIEQEAWSEIKDSDQQILFQAYLAALPYSENAKAARMKLKSLATGKAPKIVSAFESAVPPDRSDSKRTFWTILALLGFGVVILTIFALTRYYSLSEQSLGLLMAAMLLAPTVFVLFAGGRRLYPNVMDSPGRSSILFHAGGSVTILLWITLTQATAETFFRGFAPNGTYLVRPGLETLNSISLVAVLISAIAAQWVQSLRFVWYLIVPVVGVIYILSNISYMDGLFPRTYLITTALNVYGGVALVLLGAVPIIFAWRDTHRGNARDSTVKA